MSAPMALGYGRDQAGRCVLPKVIVEVDSYDIAYLRCRHGVGEGWICGDVDILNGGEPIPHDEAEAIRLAYRERERR